MPSPRPDRRRRASDSYAFWWLTIGIHTIVTLAAIALLEFTEKIHLSAEKWSLFAILCLIAHMGASHLKTRQGLVRCLVPTRLREALATIPDGLLLTDDRDQIVLANEVFLGWVGMEKNQVVGRTAASLPWIRSSATTDDDLPWILASNKGEGSGEQLMRFQVPDGNLRCFAINSSPVKTDQEGCQGVLITLRDVTQIENRRAKLEQMLVALRHSRDQVTSQNRELRILADQDPLTECLNRRSFFEQFEEAWLLAQSHDLPLACLMLDVDHFKQVNDLFGHQVGDEVLCSVSEVLRKHVLPPSLVGRYGGEEFCVMMPETDLASATQFANVIRQQIENTRFKSHPSLRLGASIGVSVRTKEITNLQELICQADECLYFAKDHGRNQVINPVSQQSVSQQAGTSESSLAVETHGITVSVP